MRAHLFSQPPEPRTTARRSAMPCAPSVLAGARLPARGSAGRPTR